MPRCPSRPLSARPPVRHPVSRPRSEPGGAVAGVGEMAAIERQAAAADALGEPSPEAFQLGDALLDTGGPGAGKPGPVVSGRYPFRGKPGQLAGDLVQGEPDALGKDNERDPPEDRTRIAPMPRSE